mmetsp:Transcript_107881/g.348231  ORF Transcript_107881/g.348231 Transcript_107881/m.348231 type:complete len:363 (-) Transcript_107881:2232-3320(-)
MCATGTSKKLIDVLALGVHARHRRRVPLGEHRGHQAPPLAAPLADEAVKVGEQSVFVDRRDETGLLVPSSPTVLEQRDLLPPPVGLLVQPLVGLHDTLDERDLVRRELLPRHAHEHGPKSSQEVVNRLKQEIWRLYARLNEQSQASYQTETVGLREHDVPKLLVRPYVGEERILNERAEEFAQHIGLRVRLREEVHPKGVVHLVSVRPLGHDDRVPACRQLREAHPGQLLARKRPKGHDVERPLHLRQVSFVEVTVQQCLRVELLPRRSELVAEVNDLFNRHLLRLRPQKVNGVLGSQESEPGHVRGVGEWLLLIERRLLAPYNIHRTPELAFRRALEVADALKHGFYKTDQLIAVAYELQG